LETREREKGGVFGPDGEEEERGILGDFSVMMPLLVLAVVVVVAAAGAAAAAA
jgi:hypothetical protein